jgi:hypothetical protein
MEIEDVFYFVESNNLLTSNDKYRFITIKLHLSTLIKGLEITGVDAEEEHYIFERFEDVSNLLEMLKYFRNILNEIKNFRKYFASLITEEHLVIINKVDSFEKQFTELKIKFIRYCRSKKGNHYSSYRTTTASPSEFDRLSFN